ncbi:MAG: AtpZ/AtpI family protein [Bacteroidales bacterium]
MEEPSSPKGKRDSDKEPETPFKSYAKYSGIAVQMIVIILVSVWGGRKLDEIAGTEIPVFTAILSLVGVVAAIYTSIKDLIR